LNQPEITVYGAYWRPDCHRSKKFLGEQFIPYKWVDIEQDKRKEYDLVIVGAGSGGLSAAAFAVQLGACAALVEKNRIGGDCTWSGCVPSKTLLKTAKVAREMRTAGRYGLPSAQPLVDLKAVMAHFASPMRAAASI
jgi:hypothetical protein